MTTLLTRLRRTFSQGGFLLMLQASALVLGPLATPKCAYGPPDNGWDDFKSDAPFYDGRGSDSADVSADVALPTDQVPPQELIPDDAVLDGPPTTKYGPLYCDSCGDADAVLPDTTQDAKPDTSDVSATWYGTIPPDAADAQPADTLPDVAPETNCEPMDMYGPPPCTDDSDCASYGEGFYCDKTHTVNDSCGQPMEWPVCQKK